MEKSISVAVLDTGIYNHIDFNRRIIGFYDCVQNRTCTYDDSGHGTHVSGIIAGSGYASHGKYKGIAPMVNLVGVKVLDKNGNGRIEHVIKGAEWVIKNCKKYNIKVANISFGTTDFKEEIDSESLVHSIEEMWQNGITVVAAAGNSGPKKCSITSPGISKKIITVGAFDDDSNYVNIASLRKYNRKKYYSGRGPTKECIVKPDVVVTGTNIIACSNINNGYSVKSGTSMAAPIVSGAVARVLSKENLTPKQIKQRIYNHTIKISIPEDQQGLGMLDVVEFIKNT